jgi:hypothetical protein
VLPVRLRSIADAELAEATKWYASRSRDVASRFLDAVEEALERIRLAPTANPLVTPTLRRVLLRRFPYACITGSFQPSSVWWVSCTDAGIRGAGCDGGEA